MPNILDNVVNNIERHQKSLVDYLRQLGRIAVQSEKRGDRRQSEFLNKRFAKKRLVPMQEAIRQKKFFQDEIGNVVGDEAVDVGRNTTIRLPKSYHEFMESCTSRPYPQGGYQDCRDEYFREGSLNYVPDDFERQIRMDPLMYVDHPSRIVRNFARGLINGDIQ